MKTSAASVWTASDVAHAVALRAEHPGAVVVAGGTDVMVYIEAGALDPSGVISIWGCDGFRGIAAREGGGCRLGALTTWTDIVRDGRLPDALVQCARTVGAAQIQNRGTVGGNIANASPAGDSLPLWLALDADIELVSVRGTRAVPAAEFWRGYKQTAMRADELVAAVVLPPTSPEPDVVDRVYYRKVGTRLAQAISKVVLGGRLRLRGRQVVEARVALGAVGPVPLRCAGVEAALAGRSLDDGLAEAVAAVAGDISPIDDVRSSREYRERVATNIVEGWLKAELAHMDGQDGSSTAATMG